jgi:hypothetical protein
LRPPGKLPACVDPAPLAPSPAEAADLRPHYAVSGVHVGRAAAPSPVNSSSDVCPRALMHQTVMRTHQGFGPPICSPILYLRGLAKQACDRFLSQSAPNSRQTTPAVLTIDDGAAPNKPILMPFCRGCEVKPTTTSGQPDGRLLGHNRCVQCDIPEIRGRGSRSFQSF